MFTKHCTLLTIKTISAHQIKVYLPSEHNRHPDGVLYICPLDDRSRHKFFPVASKAGDLGVSAVVSFIQRFLEQCTQKYT